MPRAMAVVGASVIGIEYASMFAALGVPVTLIEKRERPLEFLDHEIVDELMHQMRHRNVTFRLGETVESIEVTDGPPRRAVICSSRASASSPTWSSSRPGGWPPPGR